MIYKLLIVLFKLLKEIYFKDSKNKNNKKSYDFNNPNFDTFRYATILLFIFSTLIVSSKLKTQRYNVKPPTTPHNNIIYACDVIRTYNSRGVTCSIITKYKNT